MKKQLIVVLSFFLLCMLATITAYGQTKKVTRNRVCSVCKQSKPLSAFSGNSQKCKVCTQKVAHRYEQQETEYRRQQQLEQERLTHEQAEKERLAQEQAERERIAFRDKVNSLIKMVYVEGGTFTMGGYSYPLDGKPEHQVTISSFSIGETEVTQELWVVVMGSNPSKFKEQNFQ